MKTIRSLILIAFVGLFSMSVIAQGDIISAADFMSLYKTNKSLAIIDASKADTYKQSHIKNAVNIPHATLNKDSEIDGLIKTPHEIAEILGKMGVSNTSTIVVYDEGSQKYSSRVYWVLKYLGAKDVKILHKDMMAFKKARVPLTALPARPKPATFTVTLNKAVYADINEIKAGKAKLIDVRSPEEYNGTADNSEGHLPGAINIPYQELLTENGAFKSKAEMEKVVSKFGITANTPVIAYCRTSVRAAVLYAAFVNVLGYKNVKVYDGAYAEWVVKGNPVDTKAGVNTKKSAKPVAVGGC
jgi:thiosulfate/3-mercaptopyruvate sulfurtransferase